jgi:plasmid stabilization system protein ParE
MDYRIVLAPRAVSDLEDIVRYIALHNPEAAKKLGQKLLIQNQRVKPVSDERSEST